MKTVGIMAEYDPFHNGHLYQMQEARRCAGADYVVVAMSGDFVQRGEPALLDKWVRARMALQAGADLVLELPVRVATGSAEYFARGGVSLLSSLGVVDALSFGYESMTEPALNPALDPVLNPSLDPALDPAFIPSDAPSDALSDSFIQKDLRSLEQAADFFSREETDTYREELKKLLSSGMTYAQARVEAYTATEDEDTAVPADLLKSPNNILAIEYLKAIRQLHSTLSVVPVPRFGAGYHDPALPQPETSDSTSSPLRGQTPKSLPASASGIRSALSRKEFVDPYMPQDAYALMMEQLTSGRSLILSDLDLLMHEALLRKKDHLEEYLDVGVDLANRIRSLLSGYTGYESFAMQLKTRQVTLTRVRRALLHILLGIRSTAAPAAYVRVLGFRKTAQPLLHRISQESSVSMITKLPKEAPEGLEEDLNAAHMWEMLVCHKTGRPLCSEYQRQLVIL